MPVQMYGLAPRTQLDHGRAVDDLDAGDLTADTFRYLKQEI
jgi:hypothetical protein